MQTPEELCMIWKEKLDSGQEVVHVTPKKSKWYKCIQLQQCPLQISLSVQLHYNCRSRYLINVLHQLGYCLSFYCLSFTVKENTPVLLVANNVDHNVCTLDGKNTFHKMGMIVAITQKIKIHPSIHRHNVGDNDIKKITTVDIREHRHVRSMLRDISFRKLPGPTATISRLSLL